MFIVITSSKTQRSPNGRYASYIIIMTQHDATFTFTKKSFFNVMRDIHYAWKKHWKLIEIVLRKYDEMRYLTWIESLITMMRMTR